MLLLKNADVYAPEPRGRTHLLVGAERILWMGSGDLSLPAALEVEETDLGGRRVVPGLIDCHVHLTGGGGEDGFRSRVPPVPLSALTRAGTTTVVGVLGTDDVTRGTAGLVAAARGLCEEGITAFCLTGGYHIPPVTLTGSVQGDIVHVEPIVGVGEVAVSDHRSSAPTVDGLLRVASEAHVGGLLSGKAGVAHLHLGGGKRGLAPVREALDRSDLPPRVFHPTHVNRHEGLFSEALDLARTGSWVDVTASPGRHSLPGAEAVRRYLESGAPEDRLTVSTDAGGSLPAFDADGRTAGMAVGDPSHLARTLAEVVAGGIPLERALPPFTSNVARLFRFVDRGTLRPGGAADLVVLGDGCEVTDVMARGRWHVRRGKVLVRGSFEER